MPPRSLRKYTRNRSPLRSSVAQNGSRDSTSTRKTLSGSVQTLVPDAKLDAPARYALRRDLSIRAQRLEIRALGRDEGQRPVVEHHPDDDAAGDAAAHADAATGAQHVPLARPERRHLVNRLLPGAPGRAIRSGRILRQAQREWAEQRPVGAVELDRRRQSIGGQIGARPDRKRTIGRRRAAVRTYQFVETTNLVDLV